MYELGALLNNFENMIIMQNKILKRTEILMSFIPPNDLARIGSEQGVPFSLSAPKVLT
jgi:hypothetical protein